MKKAILPLILAFLIAPGPVLTPAEEAPAGETPPTSGITPPPEPGMFEGVLPQKGFVRQEDVPWEKFITNRFGKNYA